MDLCTNLQKKHCNGEQIFLVVMELLNNAHHIGEMDLGDFPQVWKKSDVSLRVAQGGSGWSQGWLRGGSGVTIHR